VAVVWNGAYCQVAGQAVGGVSALSATANRRGAGDAARQQWLLSAEIAALLDVDVRTVKGWADAGRLPYARTLGGQRRYPERAVRELLAGAGPDEALPGRLLPIREVARRLGVGPGTVRAWTERGWLVAVRTPGGERRYPEAVIEALRDRLGGSEPTPGIREESWDKSRVGRGLRPPTGRPRGPLPPHSPA